MRPLELRLRNFRSYFGEETTLSFRDRSLLGIVGPIGSGKSPDGCPAVLEYFRKIMYI